MAGGGAGDVGDFAFDPEAGEAFLEQCFDLAVELADRDCRRHPVALARFFHPREYNQARKAFAENLIGVELAD